MGPLYTTNNLPKTMEDEGYIVNLNEDKSIVVYWIALYANNNESYFDKFGVEHISKEIKRLIGNINIITNNNKYL